MAGEQEQVKFDLDAKEALMTLKGLQDSFEAIGSAKNLAPLAGHLGKIGGTVAILGASFLALKTTIDLVFEGENIKQINAQFEMLTKNAGVAGDVLKDALEKAAKGLVDDEELLKAANKSLLTFEGSARQLPEIFDLARKATSMFGGNLVSNFEAINQAIATGNQRALKNMGIIVDSDEAYKKYAASVGTTVAGLTDNEKKQAMLNAVLDKGKTAFQGINEDLKKNQNLWEQLKVTLGDIKDVAAIAVEKTAGGSMSAFLTAARNGATSLKLALLSTFGTTEEKAKSNKEILLANIAHQEAALKGFELSAASASDKDITRKKQLNEAIAGTQGELKKLRFEYGLLQEEERKLGDQQTDNAKKSHKISEEDLERQRKRRLQVSMFEQSLSQMQLARIESEKRANADEEMSEMLLSEQISIIRQQSEAKKAEIAESGKFTTQQAYMLEEQIAQETEARIRDLYRQRDEAHAQALDNMVRDSETASEGIANSFKSGARKAAMELKNSGKTGELVFSSFKKHSTAALLAMGDGSKSAGEAMKGFLFGAIADIAEAKGQVMLLSGIWPPNPAAIAGGAALIVLAGFLRGQAGGKGGGGGGGIGGASGGGAATTDVTGEKPDVPDIPKKKEVTIQVQGHYFETEQTRTRLMDLVREATDATDFKYVQIGDT